METKTRKHKVMDKHPIGGSLLFSLVMLLVLLTITNIFLTPLVLIFGQNDNITLIIMIITTILSNFIIIWWFRPETKGMFAEYNLKPAMMICTCFFIYWVVGTIFMLIEGIKIGFPSFAGIRTSLFAGISEEVIFRAFIILPLMRRDADKKRMIIAMIISSVLFGLIHGANALEGADPLVTLNQVVVTALLGMCFCALFLASGNLIFCILMHALTDIVAFMNVTGVSDNGIMQGTLTKGTIIDDVLVIVIVFIVLRYFFSKPVMDATTELWKKKWKVAESEYSE
ncbi:MAG: CPBP family intramembrane metalloprotease [Lachnospiraceae bacterium]|nr:CPBP family intramembrane metalloprotease [Lachnospiraceae bacterium]